MCVAVSGLLIEKMDNTGRVNIRGNVIAVELGIVDAEVGEYVLVHAGCAIAKMTRAESDELDTLLDEVNL
jgi:hydrogenase expression/formation protein HypC